VTTVTAISRRICHHPFMRDPILVREWAANTFHRRVLELEAQGYVSRRESYRVTPEMHPETGVITLLHTIELLPPEAEDR
jgi:hypothetical protein